MHDGSNVAVCFQSRLKSVSNGLSRPWKLRFYPLKEHHYLCKRLYRLFKNSGIIIFAPTPTSHA